MTGRPVPNAATRRTEAATPAGSVTAKAASAVLAADNHSRAVLVITNDGNTVVYIALGPTATKNKGIRLNPNGGSFVVDNYTGVVSCCTAEGESVVTFSEV